MIKGTLLLSILVKDNGTQYCSTQYRDSSGNIPLPADQQHILDVAKWW